MRRLRGPISCSLFVLAAIVGGGCGGGNSTLSFSPSPGMPVASSQTQISVRGASASQLHGFTVTGSRSGDHAGRLRGHRDGLGASFLPQKPFDPGERVDVSVQANGRKRTRFHFTVARPAALSVSAGPPGAPTQPGQVQSFHSQPELHPPTVTITQQASGTPPGDIFLSPINKLGQAGPLILDGHGRPIWFHPLSGSTQAFGFQEQRYQGRPVLTWWQGIVSSRGYGVGEDVAFDRAYRQVATVKAANGYSADLHDFVITPQGTALLFAYNPVHMDLSSVGGPHDGVILDGVLQEVDIRTGLVVFEWHSVGHVDLHDSYEKPSGGVFDYFHINSVQLDSDGNLLVSARNTWTVYKINHRTGQIMWRLGGKRSNFKMGSGTRFAYQHDARRQPDGTITLFDNGATPQVHPQSRAIALKLDMNTRRAGLVGQWTHPTKLVAGSQGSVQSFQNGDRFVGWGAEPNLTEFNPRGQVLFDATIAGSVSSYRAFAFPWTGTPSGRPSIATAGQPGGKVLVYASWNGATAIARWRVLGGSSSATLSLRGEAPRGGFETAIAIPSGARYIAVQALDSSGRVLGSSAPVRPGAAPT